MVLSEMGSNTVTLCYKSLEDTTYSSLTCFLCGISQTILIDFGNCLATTALPTQAPPSTGRDGA